MKRGASSFAILLATGGLAVAQGNRPFRTETKEVLVDAVVTDKKGYVHGLTANDFEVFEDGKKQTISSISAEAGAPASQAHPHYVILLFDNSAAGNTVQLRSREAATQFIDANAGPGRMVAIVNFRGSLQVAQNFTDNEDQLKNGLNGTGGLSPATSGPDLSRTLANPTTDNLFLAIQNLALNLGSAPGRKTLILFGADPRLRVGERRSEINAVLDACNRANIAIYAIDTRGLVASPTSFGGTVNGGEPPVDSVIGGPACTLDPNRPGCDPESAETAALEDTSRDLPALAALSLGSGGFMISNTNNLAGALEKIRNDQTEYYLLGYTPPDSPEGTCHKLRVKVNRRGATARARAGYCNARSNNVLAGSPIERELESLPASPQGGARASLEAPFFYTAQNLARVNVAMEISVAKLKAEHQGGKLRASVQVLGIARRQDGSQAARFSDSVRLEFDDEKQLAAFRVRPFSYENQFDIVPGSYTFEVAYSIGGAEQGKVKIPLSVDPYEPTQFALSGLALSREFGPVSDPRMRPREMWMADRTPLIAEGLRLIPSGSNHFTSKDTVAVYAEIYEPLLTTPPKAPIGVGIGMRVIDRKTGRQMLDTGIIRIALPATRGNAVVPVAKRVPIDSLPPGSYRLELEAGDNTGRATRRYADLDIE